MYIYFILFMIIMYSILLSKKETFKVVTVKSNYNNNYYNVRNDFENTKDAANILAQLRGNLNILIDYLNKKYSDQKNVKNLNKRFNFDTIVEARHEDDTTSFTINKGEEMHVCLREKDSKENIHDLNTLMFVILHELAHIMSDSIGHNKEFKDNFKFILNNARDINLYKYVDYVENPQSYCGLKINSSPIYI